jgi:quercetin dioxygenase-like cupin family protein
MSLPQERLRTPPAERFAGTEHRVRVDRLFAALRTERHPARDSHRQMTVLRRGPLRLLVFAFERGGRLRAHRAPGFVVIHPVRGALRVQTPATTHTLFAGESLVLDPGVPHDVEAREPADVLVTVIMHPTPE